MRKACADCTRKHLAQALVISHELPDYADNLDDRHLWVCVGHLAEAEAQIQRESQFIADQIRQQRLLLMKEGTGAVHRLNINLLIGLVCEMVEEKIMHPTNTPSVLGLEPTELIEGSDSGE